MQIGVAFGSILLGLLLGANASAAAVDCTACHDQGQKLAKSAHAGLTCDTCHDGYNKATHPAGITKPECATCHADQAGDYALGVHGQARKHGNDSAPDCAM